MNKRKTLVSAVLIAALSVVSLAGCGNTKSDNSNALEETVTLKIVESLTSESRTKILKEIANKYTEKHPEVSFEFISPPQESAEQKISQMLLAKDDVDIVEVRDLSQTQYVNNGWLLPLDEYLDKWNEKDTLSSASESAMVSADGKSYILPNAFYQKAIYYRKDLFENAGITEKPTTWKEIYEDAKKLRSDNSYGWSFRGGTYTHQQAEQILISNIGVDKLASPTHGYYFTKDGKTIFAQPEAKKALEFYKSLYTETAPKDSIAWGFSETVQSFENGQTAILLQDPEVISTFNDDLQDSQWDVAPFPIGDSGQALLNNGYAGWGIAEQSKHADAAADFILFLSNSENNTYWAKSYSAIPIHTNAVEQDSYFKDSRFSVYLDMNTEADVYKFVSYPHQYQAYAEYLTLVDDYYQKYFNDTITADDVLKFCDEFWTKALQDEGKLW